MTRGSPKQIVVPPFPELEFESHNWWQGNDKLPSWAGFQERHGPYASSSGSEPSDGTVAIHVRMLQGSETLSAEQIAAYRYLLENEESVAASILEAIWDYYEKVPEIYGYDEREIARHCRRTRHKGLRKVIGLNSNYVLAISKDEFAYIGFLFGCTWDQEHGLGVMTHKDRVIATGEAAYAFEDWVARRDA
jgi:hypothetical protein